MRHNVEKWNRTGLSGYVVCGSTGESVMLTPEEKLQLWEWVAEYAAPEKLLMAGTGVESVRETVWLTNKAAEMGYKAAMVRTPHYYKNLLNNTAAQCALLPRGRRPVQDPADDLQLAAGDRQSTSPPEAVAALSEHPNIIAIKESSGNIEKVMQMIREVKPGFQVLVGSAPTLWPSFAVGAVGAVLAYANAAPYSTIAIWEAHRTRESEAAAGLAEPHRPRRRSGHSEVRHSRPEARHGSERLLRRPCRLPLSPLTPAAKQEIEEAFKDLKG